MKASTEAPPDTRPPGPAGTENLGSRAARGALITLSGQGIRILLQFTGVVILARLLSPHDYGLIAIVVVIIGIGEIFRDFGLSSAAVRAPVLTDGQRTNLFWINTGIGVALGGLLFALSEPLAAAVGQAEVQSIARAMTAIFILNGLTTQFRVHLMRDLQFRRLAIIDVLAPALALTVAICAALLGWGYWALVAQQITQALVVLVGTALGARWLPSLPSRDASVRPFLRFGANLVLSQLINYGTNNVDTAVVGFVYGPTSLGLYNRAYQLVVTPLSQIQSPVTSVAIPVLAKIQDDQRRFSAYVVRGQLALGYPISLGLAGVAVAADPITSLMLGDQWLAAAPLLQLFAVAGIAKNLAFVGYWVYVVRGLSGALFKFTLATGLIPVICIAVGAQWGVIGVAAGFAIAPWLSWPISLLWLSRVTTVPTRALYSGALRIICVATLSAGAAFVVTTALPSIPAVLSIAVTGIVIAGTAGLLCLIPTFRGDAKSLLQLAILVKRRKGL